MTLTFALAARELADASGLTIRFLDVPTGESAALLSERDVPEAVVVRLERVCCALLDGDAR
jgi:hypothetical protein